MTTETKTDPLKGFLDYFKGLENPGYAVLVTGDWGSGKTHQVNDALKNDNPIYVSLFGLDSAKKVYLEVLAQSAPEAARAVNFKSAAKDKNVGLSFMGFGATLPLGAFAAAAFNGNVRRKIEASRVVVFDDLERSTIQTKIILGILNFYVEHCGCRVVVIAHDKKIIAKFAKVKEKVIGHTIRVNPKFDEVLDLMIETYSDAHAHFLRDHTETITKFFDTSTCQSLRVLKRTLDDLVRFQALFDEDQIAKTDKFDALLHLFLAFDIDIRSGALVRNDLFNRYGKSLRETARNMKGGRSSDSEEQSGDQFLLSSKKYANLIDLSSSLLADEHLVSMIADGIYEKSTIQEHLRSISYFADSKDQPAWLRFMSFDFNSDTVVEDAAAKMDDQFNKHAVESVGELIHIIALRFMRSENRFLTDGFDKILQDARAYLDKWVDAGNFPIFEETDNLGSFRGYGGYGFWQSDSYKKEFEEILDHIKKSKDRAVILFARSRRTALLNLLNSQSTEFEAELGIGQNGRQVGMYFNIPVLISIEPSEFVDKYLNLPLDRRRSFSKLLSERMWRADHEPSLLVEKDWFKKLLSEMTERSLALGDTIAGLRLKRNIPKKRH